MRIATALRRYGLITLMLGGISAPGYAQYINFDDIPDTPAMINNPSHSDSLPEQTVLDGYLFGTSLFTDLSFGTFNGTPVHNAYNGSIAMYIDPTYLYVGGDSLPGYGENVISLGGPGKFSLASARIYAPLAPAGTILNVGGYDAGEGSSGWYDNLVIPAVQPGQSPWVEVQFPEALAYTFLFTSTTPLFIDNLKVEPVPEPDTWLLLGLGGLAGWLQRRTRRQHAHHETNVAVA